MTHTKAPLVGALLVYILFCMPAGRQASIPTIFLARQASFGDECHATCTLGICMYNCTYMTMATKKLTIIVNADLHRTLLRKVGRGNIGRFVTEAVKPLLRTNTSLREGYAAMAKDSEREKGAREWSGNLINDQYAAQ